VARAGAAHVIVLFGGSVAEEVVRELLHQGANDALGSGLGWGAAAAAVAVTIYSFFTMEDPKPPQERLNRR
jgi:hypothetical protein